MSCVSENPHAPLSGVSRALGLVFGDIGTSPIYTLGVVLALLAKEEPGLVAADARAATVFGIVSTILWTLVLLVSVQYAWLAMGFSIRGEGGTVVLKEILLSKVKDGRKIAVATFLTYLGVSLLLGDGALTPAISILSAVEGLALVPGCESLTAGSWSVVGISCLIAAALFAVQSKGTDRVSGFFGPIMVVWFVVLTVSGVAGVVGRHDASVIWRAVSPWSAFSLFLHHPLASFWMLSEIILCATGAEALYADMGHLGRRPIRVAWVFVFIALCVNYVGQGSFLLGRPEVEQPFFALAKSQTDALLGASHGGWLYIPFLLLTVVATVIASQAMISGVFSLVYQGINTKIFPLMRVKHTSAHMKSQIYIPVVNWFLLVAVLFIIVMFRSSEMLANAYGMAVCGTMAISAWIMTLIFKAEGRRLKMAASFVIFLIVSAFLVSNLRKFPQGAYMAKIFSMIPFAIILLWSYGNRLKAANFRPLPLDTFLPSFDQVYAHGHIPGTALFFAGSRDMISPYIVHCVLASNIVYERNILVCVRVTDAPYGQRDELFPPVTKGLESLEITVGYMESPDIPAILAKYKLKEKTLFYGVDEIKTTRPLVRLYAMMKKITPSFVRYYELPSRKIHGVINHIEI